MAVGGIGGGTSCTVPDPLTFSIVPDDGELSLDALYRSVEDVRRLLRDVDGTIRRRLPLSGDHTVTKDGSGSLRARRWYITGFHSSSPTITLTPARDGTDSGERAVEAVVEGIRWINQPTEVIPPRHFAEKELEDLRRLRRLRSAGVLRIEFSSNGTMAAVLPRRIEEQIDRILGTGDAEYGSLEGVLEAINLHRNRTLTIWEDITGLAVRCQFPEEHEKTVRDLLRSRVRVSGLIRYFADGRPRSIAEFREIEDLTPDVALTPAGFGSIPNLTSGMASERYLRVVRGE